MDLETAIKASKLSAGMSTPVGEVMTASLPPTPVKRPKGSAGLSAPPKVAHKSPSKKSLPLPSDVESEVKPASRTMPSYFPSTTPKKAVVELSDVRFRRMCVCFSFDFVFFLGRRLFHSNEP